MFFSAPVPGLIVYLLKFHLHLFKKAKDSIRDQQKTRRDGRAQVFVCVLRELRTMEKVRANPRHVNVFMLPRRLFPRE